MRERERERERERKIDREMNDCLKAVYFRYLVG